MFEIKVELDADAGTFYAVATGFLLPIKNVKHASMLSVGPKLSVSCMFDIYLVHYGDERVGFFFTTRFKTQNMGGYLLTSLIGKGEATTVEILIKTDELVVYHYPNRGSLAVSPKVNDEIITIFQEQ